MKDIGGRFGYIIFLEIFLDVKKRSFLNLLFCLFFFRVLIFRILFGSFDLCIVYLYFLRVGIVFVICLVFSEYSFFFRRVVNE